MQISINISVLFSFSIFCSWHTEIKTVVTNSQSFKVSLAKLLILLIPRKLFMLRSYRHYTQLNDIFLSNTMFIPCLHILMSPGPEFTANQHIIIIYTAVNVAIKMIYAFKDVLIRLLKNMFTLLNYAKNIHNFANVN